MDCKANKHRPITDVADYPQEHDLTFVFAGSLSVCSPRTAQSIRLLGGLIAAEDDPNETSIIARADISEDAFYALRQKNDGQALAAVCRQMCRATTPSWRCRPGRSLPSLRGRANTACCW
jgi:hypothetical protein